MPKMSLLISTSHHENFDLRPQQPVNRIFSLQNKKKYRNHNFRHLKKSCPIYIKKEGFYSSVAAIPIAMSNSSFLGNSHVNGYENTEIEEDEKDEIMYGKRRRAKLGRGKETYADEDAQFKSKNLNAERRRRARLHQNTLQLRSLVPIITNMTKETTITDAITYIEKLQGEVNKLTELLEMEASEAQEEIKIPREFSLESYDKGDKLQIQPEVKVIRIDSDKLWMKVVFEKRNGRLTQIMEALHSFGYQMTDVSFTATRGAATFTSCLEEILGVFRSEEETRDMLLGIIGSD